MRKFLAILAVAAFAILAAVPLAFATNNNQTYTITFDTGCDVKIDPLVVPAGTKLTTQTAISKIEDGEVSIGYVAKPSEYLKTDLTIHAPEGFEKQRSFQYWTTRSNRLERTYDTGAHAYGDANGHIVDTFTVDSDMTLYAAWYTYDYNTSFVQNTFQYFANGGYRSMDPAPSTNDTDMMFTPSECKFVRPGYRFVRWSTFPDGSGVSYLPGNTYFTSSWVQPLYAIWEEVPTPAPGTMYRLYNPNSGEHFYTSEFDEYANVVIAGWNDEGYGWQAPVTSNTPVFRMYNPNAGEHHYTPDAAERDMLINAGWKDEGIGWYSDDAKSVPLYRDYNPNEFANNHNYTTSITEHEWLISLGWRDEGYAWYGV